MAVPLAGLMLALILTVKKPSNAVPRPCDNLYFPDKLICLVRSAKDQNYTHVPDVNPVPAPPTVTPYGVTEEACRELLREPIMKEKSQFSKRDLDLPSLVSQSVGESDHPVCFQCAATSYTQDHVPNENCTVDIGSIQDSVKMGITMQSCSHGCSASVLRLGSFITAFRGCHEDRLYPPDQFDEIIAGNYRCRKARFYRAEWYHCTCDTHFCNSRLPTV